MTQIVSETRERFIRAIAEQVSADRIAEIHFFNPIRQGGLESGVAVLALTKPGTTQLPPESSAIESDAGVETDREANTTDIAADADPGIPPDDTAIEPIKAAPPRHTVYTAHYRHTLKGLDRGKWQVTVVEEADAPLITVETVVRGVQRRAGDLDDPERLDGDAVREILAAAASRAAS